jgi:integrase
MEILMMAPTRLKNLKDIQIGVQLLTDRHGAMTLVLAEEEVKNGMPSEIVLPESSARLIAFYLSSHRPALATPGSLWLFPGTSSGAPKTAHGLRQQISLCIARRVGLRFNPHLFRHLAAKIILDAHPGAYGLVQRVLGHKSIRTVMDFYTGTETTAAFAHYNTLMLKLRGELPVIDAAGSTKGKRKPKERS